MPDTRTVAERLLRFLVLVQARAGSRYFRLLDELELSTAQYRALSTLSRATRTLTVRELARAVALSAPATSRLVEDLVRRGWLTREEDDRDRRQKRVAITAGGAAALRQLDEARLAELSTFLTPLSQAERRALVDALEPVLLLAHDG